MSLETEVVEPVAEAPAAPAPDTPAPAPEAKSEPQSEGDKAAAAEAALDNDLRKVFRNANRDRDESGKFAPKDGKPPAPIDGKAEAQPVVEAKRETPATPAVPPPQSWTPEAKAQWAKLPPEAQAYVAQREADAHKAISQLGQTVKGFEPLAKVITPHVDRIAAVGDTPADYIAKMFAADQYLSRDPVNAIKWLADSYKVDLNALADPFASPADPQSQQLSAQLSAALQKIDLLERLVSDTRQVVHGRETQEQMARQSAVESTIESFAADKPDFDSLETEILTLIPAVKKSKPDLLHKDVLQEAYDRARWANPATRQKLIEQQRTEAEAKRLEAAKSAAANAKRSAAINVNGSAPVRGLPALEDDLRSIWRRNHAN